MTTAAYRRLSPCLGFRQMGSGSIHNSFDLGKVITTEGISATAKHQDPKQLWSWHRWMRFSSLVSMHRSVPRKSWVKNGARAHPPGRDIEIPGHHTNSAICYPRKELLFPYMIIANAAKPALPGSFRGAYAKHAARSHPSMPLPRDERGCAPRNAFCSGGVIVGP